MSELESEQHEHGLVVSCTKLYSYSYLCTISHVDLSFAPPYTRRVTCSTQRASLPDADWCMQSDVMPDSRRSSGLEKVDKDRKCFRMIGGVLVERTVRV